MSEHLPECPVPEMDGLWGLPLHPEDAEANCICDRLRACEQRVLNAAREAIAALPRLDMSAHLIDIQRSLAAIDALREEKP